MKLGDLIQKLAKPFRRSKEPCQPCEEKRVSLNRLSDRIIAFLKKPFL